MKIKEFDAIIFDLGGVIINLNYDLTIRAFESLGMSNFSDSFTQLSQNALFDDYETGSISSQHFINKLLPYLQNGTSPNQVVAAWNAMILDVPKEKIALLDHLKSQYRTFLLSNTNDIHMEKVRREWAKATDQIMDRSFETIYLSCELGLRKPNPELFTMVCEKEGLNPSKTLFIDDSPQHIEGAKSIGLSTLLLKDPKDLYAIFS